MQVRHLIDTFLTIKFNCPKFMTSPIKNVSLLIKISKPVVAELANMYQPGLVERVALSIRFIGHID